MATPIDNLASHLDLHEKGRPTHPAIVSPEATWDYAELAVRTRGLATLLADRGVRAGDLLGIALRDTPWHALALFAAMRLGAPIVPMDWRWTKVETQALANHFGVRWLLCEQDAPDIEGVQRMEATSEWLALSSKGGDVACARGGPLALSLSSGTTGRPTGPMLTHAMMRARIENQAATLTFNQQDRHLSATPLYFGGGRSFAVGHLVLGATLAMLPHPYAPEDVAAAVKTHEATTTFLVPTLLRRLLALDDRTLAPMGRLRLLVSSGAPLHPPERAEIARRVTPGFVEYFASTEGGGVAVLAPGEWSKRPDSVGRAAFGVELEVVGDDHQSLPPGEEGLVRYRGPGVATEFHGDAEKSAEAFRDGWFYPGDVGRRDEEGYLTLLGRAKNVVIRGGVNVYPAEIERALEGHPDVSEAVVIGVPDPEFGEVLRAVVALRRDVSTEALRDHVRARLAPYKTPRDVVVVDALPRNSAGKVALAEAKARWGGDANSGFGDFAKDR